MMTVRLIAHTPEPEKVVAAAVEALAMVQAMALNMVLEITAVQRRKRLKSIFPLQVLLPRNRPLPVPNTTNPATLWSTRCSAGVRWWL